MAVVYVDMDGVLANFKSALQKRGLPENLKDADDLDGLFIEMDPMPGAINGFRELNEMGHDVYILSTAPWKNPSAWSDKLIWVKQHLGDIAEKKLILSHNKDHNLLHGDYLIDDRDDKNGAEDWKDAGKLLHFGYDFKTNEINEYPNWDAIINFFKSIE